MHTFTKKDYTIYITLLFILCLSSNASAQVTIGSNQKPNTGSLLDLKEKQPSIDNLNATRGLLLPRVKLTTLDNLKDLITNGQITDETNKSHTGLLVYNLTEKGPICRGLYVWNSEQWTHISDTLQTIIDMEGNRYPIRWFGKAGYWMVQNLRSTYNDIMPKGTLYERSSSTSNSEKIYYYPQNKNTFNTYPEYGLLYSWSAATNGTYSDSFTSGAGSITSTIQGICPKGWVIPSDYDWTQLEFEIAKDPQSYSSNYGTTWVDNYSTTKGTFRPQGTTNGHGKSMKSSAPVASYSAATNGLSFPICDGIGFNILLIGLYTSSAQGYGSQSYIWSSSYSSGTSYWVRAFLNSDPGVLRTYISSNGYLTSIRCKKAAF